MIRRPYHEFISIAWPCASLSKQSQHEDPSETHPLWGQEPLASWCVGVTYCPVHWAGTGVSLGFNSLAPVFLHLPQDSETKRVTACLGSTTRTMCPYFPSGRSSVLAALTGPEDRGWTHTTSSLSHDISKGPAPSTSQQTPPQQPK